MPAQIEIVLSDTEKQQLEKNIRSRKTPVRLRDRSQIILMAAESVPNYKIAKRLKLDINTVGRWRNRFVEEGYSSIEKDRPRGANQGGKDSTEQAKVRSVIIRKTTQEKPEGGTHWSVRSLARELGTTHSLVGRVWLNLVERFFGLITEKQIRRGVFSSVAALEQAIHEFIERHNANKKPFVWTLRRVPEIFTLFRPV